MDNDPAFFDYEDESTMETEIDDDLIEAVVLTEWRR